MEPVIRATVVYLFLLLIFRISGKRTLSDMTSFDLILLLVLSETVQNALCDEDHSLTTSLLLITTFIGLDIFFSIVKQRWKSMDVVLDGEPLLLLEHGVAIEANLRRSRIDTEDILETARETRGLVRLDQIQYAILERTGMISIIPFASEKG